MNLDTERAITSTKRVIIDQITQGGTDLVFSNISGKCGFCSSDATGAIFQIIPFKDLKLGMAFSVCDSCGTPEKSTEILTNFTQGSYSLSKAPTTVFLSVSDLRESALMVLANGLGLRNIRDKDKDGGFEVTGTRDSGLTVIFRYRDMNDFAYIFMLNGVEKCRIDTAVHHLKSIAYGPDHLHESTKNVRALPTFGSPSVDIHLIKTIIAEIESGQDRA